MSSRTPAGRAAALRWWRARSLRSSVAWSATLVVAAWVVVLAAVAVLVVGVALDRTADDSLRARAQAVTAAVRLDADGALTVLEGPDDQALGAGRDPRRCPAPALRRREAGPVSALDPQHLLSSFGAVGLFVILFAETGLLIGFFLPGDSLLFTAGLLAATPVTSAAHLPLQQVLLAGAAGALAGAQVGYLIGRGAGPALLDRPDRPKLQAGVRRAQQVLDRYGHGRAVVLARFIPVVRTLMNPLAGTVGVPAGRFSLWQVLGGLVWSVGVSLAGYVLGTRIPGIDAYLLPIIAVVVVVSLIPVAVELLRARREQRS